MQQDQIYEIHIAKDIVLEIPTLHMFLLWENLHNILLAIAHSAAYFLLSKFAFLLEDLESLTKKTTMQQNEGTFILAMIFVTQTIALLHENVHINRHPSIDGLQSRYFPSQCLILNFQIFQLGMFFFHYSI